MTDETPGAQGTEPDILPGSESFLLRCVGAWTLPGAARLERRVAAMRWPESREIAFDGSGVSAMDTAGAWLLQRAVSDLERRGHAVTVRGLLPEHEVLVRLVREHADRTVLPRTHPRPWLERLGRRTWDGLQQAVDFLSFIGESTMVLLGSLARPARIRWRVTLRTLQEAGVNALPIIGLLSFLMGIVIAYQGAAQLRRYGANIFVADLVGLSMLRELGPLLTAIIAAGRSGSAYTAEIGTMKVTEEIDALRTLGIQPMDLLVLPKLLALLVALPLLTVFSDVCGVLGGMIMARSQLDVGFYAFLDRLGHAVSLTSYLIGVGKAPVFALIIAWVGCYQGFRVEGSADSVGRQTTVSVVQAIFLVIVVDALFSVVFSWLGI